MFPSGRSRSTLRLFLILGLAISHTRAEQSHTIDAFQATCGVDELNHSVLVECNRTSCGLLDDEANLKVRPDSSRKILHVHSSRAGARFVQTDLPALDYVEDAITKLFDINTTLTVLYKNSKRPKRSRLLGFGATLDLSFSDSSDLERSYGLVLDDFFGETAPPGAARLELLRIPISTTSAVNYNNLTRALLEIDQHIAGLRNYDTKKAPLKLILEFTGQPNNVTSSSASGGTLEIIRAVSRISENLSSIQIWATAFETDFVLSMLGPNPDYYEFIRKSLPSCVILTSVPFESAGNFVDKHLRAPISSDIVQGLLLKGQQSIPYNVLEYLNARPQIKVIVSVSSILPKTRDFGDWHNAEVFAIESLKHLKHGSLGFIENHSVSDILAKQAPDQDSSLYNLHMSHGTHFRGPMFYALAHFSRFLQSDCEILETSVFTQPNMFSAHYTAFKTKDNHIVAVILNGNDHLLPFRLELDNRIMLHTNLEVHSFNTIIIKP